MRIAMLVANEVVHDGRVRKTARTAASGGHHVTVYGVGTAASASVDGFELRVMEPRDPLVESRERLAAERSAAREHARMSARRAKRATKRLRRARRGLLRAHVVSYVRASRALRAAQAELDSARAIGSAIKAEIEAAKRQLGEAKHATDGRPNRYDHTWGDELRAFRPDIIHVHDYHALGMASRAAAELRAQGNTVRVIYDAHEYLRGRETREDDPGGGALYALERSYAPEANATITVSGSIARLLHDELGLRELPVVMHNVPMIRALTPAPTDIRSTVALAADAPLVVYSGAVHPRRGVDTLIEAIAKLPDVHLAIVAPERGRYRHELVETADQLGAGDRVHLAPMVRVEQVVSYISTADVGAHTPRDDGVNHVALPNKLFEYLHAGLPLVVVDLGAIGEFVRSTGVGVTCPPGDIDGLAAALSRVLADPGPFTVDRDELRQLWSWEAQEQELLTLYERLVETSPTPV